MQTTLTNPITNEILPMANAYTYDQLNRLLESKSFINLSGNQWENSGAYDNRYLNSFEYDAMGNIIHQNRYTADGVQIEDMSYGYKRSSSGELLRNRLYHINEPDILTGLSDSDIDNMPGTFNPQDQNIDTSYNYMYDEEGRLVRDKQEQIEKIIWRVDGKVKEIRRPQGSGKKNISFDYDAMGNRVAKHVYDDDWNLEYTTYYILDAQGNQLSVYNHEVSNSTVSFNLRERHIYGSSSLGIRMDSLDVNSIVTGNTLTELGKKTYSMSNHLGNVLTVVSDIKIPLSTDGITVDSYRVGIRNISDYSPFGVLLAERTVEGAFYRNGFQGQERDDEVKGEGNSVNFSYRMHDPRVGRFFAVDPLAAKYPHNSHYSFSENVLINAVELEGLEKHELSNGETVYGPYDGGYIDEFNTQFNKVENKQLVTNEIYNFDSYKKGESIVGNYLAKYIQKLKPNPDGYIPYPNSGKEGVKPTKEAATEMDKPGSNCYVVTAARVNKAYCDLYGVTPIDFTENADGTYTSESYKTSSAQSGQQNYEFAVGGALFNQNLGTLVNSDGVWSGELKKGAVIQYWRSTDPDNLISNGGHSQVFLNYTYDENGRINGMVLFDNSGYRNAPKDKVSERTYFGTNINF